MTTDLEIRTTEGVLRGTREGAVAVFRGIPYAAPPVGPHRFTAPAPPQPWEGVRDASTFGPLPPQPVRGGTAPAAGSDDWLTLNVWSPDPGAARLPVLVWIPGGAYLTGGGSNPRYDGAALAGGGAVVVTLNYRLGVEGFAHLAGVPDNRGVLDQVAALRWVRDNIAGFGGDPGTVTVFGQSAGAGSIAALLAAPAAAGLFRRAIAQSVPGTFFTPRLAADVSATIAAELGARATADELARFAPAELVRATAAVTRRLPTLVERWGPMARTPTPFSPVVDGAVLPETPWSALAGGAARDVELVVGHTRDEMRSMFADAADTTEEQARAALDGLLPGGAAAYRAAHPDAGPAALHELGLSDWLMRMPSLHLARAQHAGGGRAWTYELCWGPGPEGAGHSLDVMLVFGTATADDLAGRVAAAPDAAEEAARLGDTMRADWIRFATVGDPGWAPFDPDTRTTRVYDAEPSTHPYPEESSRRIWHEHRFDALDLRSAARPA